MGPTGEPHSTFWVWEWEGAPERDVYKSGNGYESALEVLLLFSEGRCPFLTSPSEWAEDVQ